MTATATKAPAAASFTLPKLAKGERYRGIVLDAKGLPSHHLILVAVSPKGMTHAAALKWAEGLGADLAEKREGWLLVAANEDGAVDKDAGPYWLKPQYAGYPEYAWDQAFSYGYQSYWHKDFKFRGVAVRRVAIR